MRVLIVGASGGTNLAQSLVRGASSLGVEAELLDVRAASSTWRALNGLSWRLRDKLPPYDIPFSRRLRARLGAAPKPDMLISTGLSPVTAKDLDIARSNGVRTAHYSSDDPWNPGQRAGWHHAALTRYDVVFTPRRANVDDLKALTGSAVAYLPFGYDPDIFAAAGPAPADGAEGALFVGGADSDRMAFFERFFAAGARVRLVGDYWDRYPIAAPHALGHRSPADLITLTRNSAVNLCLVRRANRDGHVMRSFEIGALGACMAAEDTEEHRELFGPHGEAVVYFSSPEDAAAQTEALIKRPEERSRMARALFERVRKGHTYADRLRMMIETVMATSFASIGGMAKDA